MAQGKLIGSRCSYVAINYRNFIIIIAGNAKIGLLKLFFKFNFFAARREKVVVSYLRWTFNRPGRGFSEERAKPGKWSGQKKESFAGGRRGSEF